MKGVKYMILYSSGCPRCEILKKKLDAKGFQYDIFNDIDKMIEMGIETVPVLEVDGEMLNYVEAVKWINEKEKEN